jgi:hypothetical protein
MEHFFFVYEFETISLVITKKITILLDYRLHSYCLLSYRLYNHCLQVNDYWLSAYNYMSTCQTCFEDFINLIELQFSCYC